MMDLATAWFLFRIQYYERKWHRIQARIIAKFGMDCGDLRIQRDYCDTMLACLRDKLRQIKTNASTAKAGK